MIGYLKGVILSKSDKELLIDAGGVGYEAQCSERCMDALPEKGDVGEIYVYAKLREEEMRLFGFISQEEKRAFLELTKISGVGAKVALAILSGLTPDDVATAVAAEDKKIFAKVPGVGPKLAARLINELKNGKNFFSPDNFIPTSAVASNGGRAASTPAPVSSGAPNRLREAVQALEGLGYDRSLAFSVLSKINAEHSDYSVERLIGEGLRQMAPAA